MDVTLWLCVATCGYLAGVTGSLLALYREYRELPQRDPYAIIILAFLIRIACSPHLHLLLALVAALVAGLTCYLSVWLAILCTVSACSLLGYIFIRKFPLEEL